MKEKIVIGKQRDEILSGKTIKIKTDCGNLYVTLNIDSQGDLFEVFSVMGKSGGCAGAHLEGLVRMISLCIRIGGNIEDIIKQLKNIRCPNPTFSNGRQITSCSDAIANILEGYKKDYY